MTAVHLHCGLRVRSELPLFLPIADDDAFDVDVRLGPDITDSITRPVGEVVAEFFDGERRLYTAVRSADGYVVRFPECGEFVVAPDLGSVSVHRDGGGKHADLMPVLMSGTVIAIVHGLLGATLIHASAVEIGGRVLAFAGRSGQGKSTLAGLMCGHGATLVTDDVLLLEPSDPPVCTGGATEVRLRPGAAAIADGLVTRTTADDRIAATLPPAATGPLPLAAIAVPVPSRDAVDVSVERVPPAVGLIAMLAFPRIAGWIDPTVIARQFETLGVLAERVPVYTATIPWGPPFDPAVAPALAALVTPDQS